MKTLKDHQDTMVSMLASGTAIPTSAIRLAHALHDVLAHLNNTNVAPVAHTERRIDATTPGLNDAMLAQDIAAVKPKQQSLESLLKQRDNTIRQLKEQVSHLRTVRYHMSTEIAELQSFVERVKEADAVKLRQSDCSHNFKYRSGADAGHCLKCGLRNVPEQAGCRKEDTQVPDDGWIEWAGGTRPVEDSRRVEVRFKNGVVAEKVACWLDWSFDFEEDDGHIIAYRVVKS